MENETIEGLGRLNGPLSLRLFLQPAIAAIIGFRDGARDSDKGAPPYFWSLAHVPQDERRNLIRNGWASVGKVFIIAFVLDCVFQYLVTSSVAILGALAVAVILAILPYLLFRGAINRWKSRSR